MSTSHREQQNSATTPPGIMIIAIILFLSSAAAFFTALTTPSYRLFAFFYCPTLIYAGIGALRKWPAARHILIFVLSVLLLKALLVLNGAFFSYDSIELDTEAIRRATIKNIIWVIALAAAIVYLLRKKIRNFYAVANRKSKRTVRNLAIGVTLGVVVTAVGLIAVGSFFTDAPLSATGSAPATAAVDGPVLVTIEVTNPHDNSVTLDAIEVPTKFFQDLDIMAVRPSPSVDSPLDILGTRAWIFETPVPPKETLTIELEVVAKRASKQVIEFTVCNFYADCSLVLIPIEFSE